jgi:hypothetical protein
LRKKNVYIKRICCCLALIALLHACFTPVKNFEKTKHPDAPDYSDENNWAALPWKKDSADAVPLNSGLTQNQEQAKADVFFIYPTLNFSGNGWNARVDDKFLNRQIDKLSVKQQASVFNESCKVYVPRYRQATLYSFADNKGNGFNALDLAYSDIKRAFEYYLKNYNNGRPIVIAGHSQGSYHGTRLIKEYFETDSVLRKKLVAAYLIGGNATPNMYATIEPCDSAAQTGCYIAWHTMRFGSRFKKLPKRMMNTPGAEAWGHYECVNPLTWKRDTLYAPAELNKGSVSYLFNKIYVGKADALCKRDVVWTHYSYLPGFPLGDNYHVADYGLYYMNIRENVKFRIEKFLEKSVTDTIQKP